MSMMAMIVKGVLIVLWVPSAGKDDRKFLQLCKFQVKGDIISGDPKRKFYIHMTISNVITTYLKERVGGVLISPCFAFTLAIPMERFTPLCG